MARRVGVAVVVAAAVVGTAAKGARAFDYREEIVRNVVDPCYLAMARRTLPPGTDFEQFVRVAKLMTGDRVDAIIAETLPMVAREPSALARAQGYRVALHVCIRSMRRLLDH